ncbi:MAG TPA: cation transporter [Atribacter sp.]|jgi:copper ion binding protein|uniref:Copper chaperone CopZ n=1 Tax=Candidatus Atribacter allofermentans TaxID=1852833 RepID=A0A1V5SIL0_9BACT|nr:cation transporter [Atribacter sp.]MDD3714066.1 cation transporter [Atribacterota bacterium]OQA54011.1 MAG: Copper chaperone CopZ [Candidatus Atribacteria bacterium ADurb.Bin276]HHT11442.1 heavy-metal-associated domain-containing protein [Candidatus Atribacteria bacterium]MDI9594173.1 cation transporter [Atribacterota bacterium]HOT05371.1 cation transporter [Atribacter sp.]
MKLKIEGMSCQHCVARVQKALQEVPGVLAVSVDLKKGEADITVKDGVTPQSLISAIKNAGYESKVI